MHRIFSVSAFLVLTLTACSSGGGNSNAVATIPSTPSLPADVTSLPAPSSVHFANYPSTDGGGGVLVGSDGAVYLDGSMNFVRFSAGSFTYYPYGSILAGQLRAGGVTDIAQAKDGSIWTIVAAAGGAAEPESGIERLHLPGFAVDYLAEASSSNQSLRGLARAADSNVWTSRTSSFDGTLIGFSPSRANVGSATPQPDGEPQRTVASGFDSALFSVSDSALATVNRIYEFSIPDGAQLNSWTLPATADVNFMTLGPDNALWFTDRGQNAIGHLSATGVLKFYSVPTAAAGLTAIAAGSDSAMWFTERDANKIGRIAMNGSINEYSLPSDVRAPKGITGGFPSCLSGTLYFTDSTGLGKLTF